MLLFDHTPLILLHSGKHSAYLTNAEELLVTYSWYSSFRRVLWDRQVCYSSVVLLHKCPHMCNTQSQGVLAVLREAKLLWH